LRDFGNTPVFVIACGPDGNDLDWTRRFFERLFKDYRKCGRIHGYAAHYYCGTAGTATQYTEAEWYELLWKAREIETLIVQQRGLMDAFDPERKVGLIIDEWGTWHPPTPPAAGRNPSLLWQQNTLRDGLVAAITLDAFNRQADKVVMANIAQLVNVLQALFLVEGGKVVTTPTYHVFEMYRNHQEGRGVRVVMDGPEVVFTYGGMMKRMAGLSGSASIKGKTLTLTVVNARVGEPTYATINLRGDTGAAIVRETVLTHGDIQACNTFEEPGRVKLTEPRVVGLTGSSLRYAFAGQSVTRLEMALV
jgi:alpha-N-arabinofuranosidase